MQIDNNEIIYLLAQNYLDAGRLNKAQTTIEILMDQMDTEELNQDKGMALLQDAITDGINACADNLGIYSPFGGTDNLLNFDELKPYVRSDKKVGRNDPCPCGSGLKYKKCCGKNQ